MSISHQHFSRGAATVLTASQKDAVSDSRAGLICTCYQTFGACGRLVRWVLWTLADEQEGQIQWEKHAGGEGL
jgi:hypothetical protein